MSSARSAKSRKIQGILREIVISSISSANPNLNGEETKTSLAKPKYGIEGHWGGR